MEKLNVHEYDGKLGETYQELKKWDNDNLILDIDFEQTIKEMVQTAIKNYDGKFRKNVINMITILQKDTGTKRNNNNSDNVLVEDIVPRIWRFYRNVNKEDQFIFFEQVCDILKGICPQGRAGARMFQLYSMLIYDAQQLAKGTKIEIKCDDSSKSIIDVTQELFKKLEK